MIFTLACLKLPAKQLQVKRKSIAGGRKSLVPSENSQKIFGSFATEGTYDGLLLLASAFASLITMTL